MGADLPLIARRAELAILTVAIEAAKRSRGEAVLLTGEAGVGKTRLLLEAQREADRRGLLILKGRAVESGGAYRPLVDAFARASLPFTHEPDLAAVRPTLARVLPGWTTDHVLAPMADPAAVLAEALILLLRAMATDGTVLLVDDLQWADEDTISVLTYLADSVEELPLALIMTARTEPMLPERLERLGSTRSIREFPLKRLSPSEVADALRTQQFSGLTSETVDQLVTAVDGLPLVLDEFVRQLREHAPAMGELDMRHTTLAAAVQKRLRRLTRDSRLVLDALSVLGEADAELLAAVTGLDEANLSTAIHDALSSTLLVTASTPLGVTWRHPLMRGAVRDLLLPLEQQALARRAADHLVSNTGDLTEGQLRQAAEMYQLAGYPDQAARQLIRAARAAVRNAALDVAQQHLAAAHALTGRMPEAAREVLIERIETLTLAGRAHDAYDSGVAALRSMSGGDARPLLVATARAAYGADLHAEAVALLARLQQVAEPTDVGLAVLRAHAALAERRIDAIALGERAAALALEQGSIDLSCEALLVASYASRRHGADMVERVLSQALSLSEEYELSVWQVRALIELGRVDFDADSDPSRFYQARERATAAGMVGMVAAFYLHIAETIDMRNGPIAAYPTFVAADTQARQLQLMGLHAHTRVHIAECLLNADDRPLPGRARPAAPTEVDEVIAEALALGEKSKPAPWAKLFLGMRAWLHGDSTSAIELFNESLRYSPGEVHVAPFWGIGPLLRVVAGADTEEAFGPIKLTGHHINWAARSFADAVSDVRGGRSAAESIAAAEYYVRHTPYMRHLLHTMIAPVLYAAGVEAALGWLREADAFCSAAGERALQRRIRNDLRAIGAKVPKTSTATVPPHLARLGITARETEILRLVNAGLSNADISHRLFISTRTVESHVSSMLQKTGQAAREELPSASTAED